MTNYQLFQCIDAGTENCPCYLAESGNCLTCSRLAGKECVDCQWRGVCIYNEYIQNGKVIKNVRQEREAKITQKKVYDEDTAIFVLDVGKGIAMKCFMPGTYVFLRRKDSEVYFNVPISVMRADVENGLIWVLIKAISAKTKRLFEETESLFVRGPYKNGIFGLDSLNDILKGTHKTPVQEAHDCREAHEYGDAHEYKDANEAEGGHENKDEHGGRQDRKYKDPHEYSVLKASESLNDEIYHIPRMLLIAKGVGIAPAEKMMQFIGDRCLVTVFLDHAKLTEELVEDCLTEEPDDYCPVDLTNKEDMEKLDWEILKGGYDAICIFTSDYFIASIGRSIQELEYEGKLLISNNFNICCGEGVCGSCSVVGENGETIKMCKCKLSGEELLKQKAVFV